ncbi:(2Fe-2S) ferredoxin domain-containing protein [Haloterrigena sp. SYSU A558-1]|uniref:(2Fe-2S) ferredoxin domain-containing protein n=1 Tax=Haloterrigena gelatinilytica TaxID=2741724 RepID=A0A8J8KK05_9EURY|nr:(2Fe-2S) ferredoxin domain-containing protein [Haloterrigena gelatinilytica]NUB93974.1 (2Fe-2S) ferredoxin domain-containing protein [Haloterrigena gelatinilytica]NUC74901.1 (2Fe-2S) ferredoxin domain-containing protein [Haloterrigena gelatinilytica]
MQRQTDRQRDRLAAQVFVCTNDRDADYACCADAGGEETLEAVKSWLRDRNAFWNPISVIETGCLGLCSEDGTAIAIQPRDEWYSDVRPAEVPDLLESEFGPDAERVGAAYHRRREANDSDAA